MKRPYLKKLLTIFLASAMFLLSGCNAGGGSSSSSSSTEKYTITFVQDGCKNIGIEIEKGGSLTDIPAPKEVSGYTVTWDQTTFENVVQDITVTAVAVPNDYLVTYLLSAEDGETMTGELTQTITYDSNYQLPVPNRYGYSFMGWSDGQKVIPKTGVWGIPHNVTLTPQWTDNSYTITFLQLDGSMQTRKIECGDVLADADIPEAISVEGYDVEWSVKDFSTITQNTTVNAVKYGKSYQVNYLLAQGETLDGEAKDVFTFGAAYELKIPQKAGYTFRFWKLADGTALLKSGTWSIARNVDVTADWTANDNVITFIHIDGSIEERTVATGGSLSANDIPQPKQVDGYSVSWDKTDFSSITGAVTVTAVKTPLKYKITYSVDSDVTLSGGNVQEVVFGADYALKVPTRYGYSFVGWRTEGGQLLASEGEWSIANNVTLTAEWRDNFCIITFVDSDNSTKSFTIEKGDSFSQIPACKQVAGYKTEWILTDINFSSITSNVTIYAKKTPNVYEVRYSLTTGESLATGVELTFNVTYGESYKLATPTHSDNALSFVYWINASTKKKVAISGVWEIPGNVKLIAVWDEKGDWSNFH